MMCDTLSTHDHSLTLKVLQKTIKIFKKILKHSDKSCKISTFNFCFLGSVILRKLLQIVSMVINLDSYGMQTSYES